MNKSIYCLIHDIDDEKIGIHAALKNYLKFIEWVVIFAEVRDFNVSANSRWGQRFIRLIIKRIVMHIKWLYYVSQGSIEM